MTFVARFVLRSIALYCAGLAVTVLTLATAVDHLLVRAGESLSPGAAQSGAVAVPVSQVLADKPTQPLLHKAQYWSNRPPQPPRPPQPVQSLGIFGLFMAPAEPPPPPETYATVCVRTCDGYYFPVSFATSPEQFGQDERKCQASCGSQARLYVYRNPGGSTESMSDLRGQPYSRLPTAFQYRTSYNESCKCKPHPWEQEATDRHRMYALEQSVRKGEIKHVAELKELQQKLKPEPVSRSTFAVIGNGSAATGPGAGDGPRTEPPGKMALGAKSAPKSSNALPEWSRRAFQMD